MPRYTKSDYAPGMMIEGGALPVLSGDPASTGSVIYGRPRPPPPADLDAIRRRLAAAAAKLAALTKRPRDA